jgi:hypothetical protein
VAGTVRRAGSGGARVSVNGGAVMAIVDDGAKIR